MHPLALTGIVAAVAIGLMIQSLYAHWRGGDRLALPYAATLVCWLALLASNYWIDSGGLTGDGRALTRVLYQITVLSVTAFLLLAMHGFFGLKLLNPAGVEALDVALEGFVLQEGAVPLGSFSTRPRARLPIT